MRSILVYLTALALFLMFGTAQVMAEEAKTLEFQKIELKVYDQMYLQELNGVTENISLGKMMFLALFLEIKPPWTDTVDKVNIGSKTVRLVSGIDTFGVVGYFDYVNQFRFTGSRSLNTSRPTKWKEKQIPIYFNLVYAIPEGKKELDFSFGENTIKLKVPAEVSPPPNPADLVDIKLVGAKLHDQFQNEYSMSSIKPNPLSVAKNPLGKILQVKFKITPKQENTWRGYFYEPNFAFSLISDSGAMLSQLGQFTGKRLSKVASNNVYPDKTGKWQTREVDLYFGAPADIKSYKLYYFWTEVGEGKIQ